MASNEATIALHCAALSNRWSSAVQCITGQGGASVSECGPWVWDLVGAPIDDGMNAMNNKWNVVARRVVATTAAHGSAINDQSTSIRQGIQLQPGPVVSTVLIAVYGLAC